MIDEGWRRLIFFFFFVVVVVVWRERARAEERKWQGFVASEPVPEIDLVDFIELRIIGPKVSPQERNSKACQEKMRKQECDPEEGEKCEDGDVKASLDYFRRDVQRNLEKAQRLQFRPMIHLPEKQIFFFFFFLVNLLLFTNRNNKKFLEMPGRRVERKKRHHPHHHHHC